jgi:hypothetical protein
VCCAAVHKRNEPKRSYVSSRDPGGAERAAYAVMAHIRGISYQAQLCASNQNPVHQQLRSW